MSMKNDNKEKAVCHGEDKQQQCLKQFPKSHILGNGYKLSDHYIVVKAYRYAKKGKL